MIKSNKQIAQMAVARLKTTAAKSDLEESIAQMQTEIERMRALIALSVVIAKALSVKELRVVTGSMFSHTFKTESRDEAATEAAKLKEFCQKTFKATFKDKSEKLAYAENAKYKDLTFNVTVQRMSNIAIIMLEDFGFKGSRD